MKIVLERRQISRKMTTVHLSCAYLTCISWSSIIREFLYLRSSGLVHLNLCHELCEGNEALNAFLHEYS